MSVESGVTRPRYMKCAHFPQRSELLVSTFELRWRVRKSRAVLFLGVRYTQRLLKRFNFGTGDCQLETTQHRSRVFVLAHFAGIVHSADGRTGCAKTNRPETVSGTAVAVDRTISRRTGAGGDGRAGAAGSLLFRE